MTDRTLAVWWEDAQVGALVKDRYGDLSLAYDPAWLAAPAARAISRSLPLTVEPFDRDRCTSFFGDLLAHADQGEASAGALTLLPTGLTPPRFLTGATTPLDEEAFADILDRLQRQPLPAAEAGGRTGLAQAKLPVILIDGRPALPAPGQPSTHIVKPEPARFPGAVANEAWSMALAAATRAWGRASRGARGSGPALSARYPLRSRGAERSADEAASGGCLSGAGHRTRAQICCGGRSRLSAIVRSGPGLCPGPRARPVAAGGHRAVQSRHR